MAAAKSWTEEELSELVEVFSILTEEELVEKFGRLFPTIKTKYYRIKKDVIDTEETIAREEDSSYLYIPSNIKKYKNVTNSAKEICRALQSGYFQKIDSYLLCTNKQYKVIPKNDNNQDLVLDFDKADMFSSYLCSSNNIVCVEDTIMIMYYIKKMYITTITYDPQESDKYKILSNGAIKFNTFEETEYLELARTTTIRHNHLNEEEFKKKFPRTFLLLMNLFEENYEYVKIFINNISAIANTRSKLGAITIMKGLQGAGKNQLGEEFLVPLFGKKQVIITDSRRIEANFNSALATAFIVIIDETKNEAGEMNAFSEMIKSISTGEDIMIEKKFMDAKQQKTYFNFFLMSNNNKAGKIDLDDRRHYVFGTVDTIENRAEKILNEDMETYWAKLRSEETDEFLKYLVTLDYKIALARKASLLNQTKVRMILGTGKRYELFFKILQTKKIEFINYLLKEIREANAERDAHNVVIRTAPGARRDLVADFLVKDFINQAIKGAIRKELVVSIFDLFINDEKNWSKSKLKKIANESLDEVKINGYYHYKTSPSEVSFTFEDVENFKLYEELYEDTEEVF